MEKVSQFFDIMYENEKVGHVSIDTPYVGDYNTDSMVEFCGFKGRRSHFNNIYQFEFLYEGDAYLVNAYDEDTLIEILESLE